MLKLLGKIYGKLMNVRNTLYDKGTLKSYSLGARTISVGNITAGGTGKTPLVAYITNALADRGENVCILTRGYGRKNENERVLASDENHTDAELAGDEPLELAKALGEKAVVVSDADRVGAARWAKEKFGITAFILDDGFQHRKAKRDFDIVCIDATNPFGNEKVLPAGRLRESLANLRRADVIMITRTNLVEDTDNTVTLIRKYNAEAPIFGSATRIKEITKLDDFLTGNKTSDDSDNRQFVSRPFAFCGLGNPQIFFDQMFSESFCPVRTARFPDHYLYTQRDIETLESDAKAAGATALVTTAKDAVKLYDLEFKMPCFVATIGIEIDNEAAFIKML